MNQNQIVRVFGFALLLGGMALPAVAATPCADLVRFSMAGHNVQIEKAQNVAAGPAAQVPSAPPGPRATLPAHCRVDGVLDQQFQGGQSVLTVSGTEGVDPATITQIA